jgi:UDP-glucose 4-epimerase
MMPGCLVTGVAGFVGSHLAERLLARDCRVVGVDNFSSGYPENMANFRDHPQFIFHERSIAEAGLLAELTRAHPFITHCFHLAAIVSVPYSVAHPEETMAINHAATVALLCEARAHGCEAFLFAGSAAEYGKDERLPLLEHYATNETQQVSPYGRAKFLASRAVAASRAPRGVALRCFNIYGPRQDPGSPYSGVISRFMEAGAAHTALTIFGDGGQTRDFIYVDDVVSAYLRAAGLAADGMGPGAPAGVYNVATGKATSILELAHTIRRLTANDQPLLFGVERPGDIRHSRADWQELHRATGWLPKVVLEEGLERTYRWLRAGSR